MSRPPNPDVLPRLLERGADLIQRRGFNGCGVQDLTAAAGIPKGSFYNYFASKEEFAVAILDQYWGVIESQYLGVLSNDKLDPVSRIKKHFSGLIGYHERQNFAFGCLIGNIAVELSAQSAAARAKIKSLLHIWAMALADCLDAAKIKGQVPSGSNTSELSAALIDTFEGAVMAAKVDQGPKALRRFETLMLPKLLA
jgi:TetR/AcrR family transcriptional regulator, transcriptional repressor for nem operon